MKFCIFIPLFLFFAHTFSYASQNFKIYSFETSKYIVDQVANIIFKIDNRQNIINLENSSSAKKIIIDLKKNNKISDQDIELTVNCMSSCAIKIVTNYKIKNLKLNNAYFFDKQSFIVEDLKIYSSHPIHTTLPKVLNIAEIFLSPSLDMLTVSNIMKAINIIPGTGEYVYDTKIVTDNISKKPINSHNDLEIADALYNLKSLKKAFPKLQWTAPVVGWFAINNKNTIDYNVKNIDILPGVENRNILHSEIWQVNNFNRANAHLINKENNQVRYSGTINDNSLLRYINELKAQNYKVMFYPMLYLDMPNKPWRGKLFAQNTADIDNFFNKPNGFNSFILHYAKLLKGKIDAFIIGSEMEDLLQYVDNNYSYENPKRYPGVFNMIKLAKKVKEIMGQDVIITYAANWSEYHHDKRGFYHLDYLWSSPYIDVVGIDAYLPLTTSNMGDITIQQIKSGWESGNLWNYYYNKNTTTPIPPEYGLKKIEYWWSNTHKFGNYTSKWLPKMKKIWFTEFGFPSIHLATNTPHIAPELGKKSARPTYSSGNKDFALQIRAIRATLEYWQNKSYIVDNSFLWAWDARPYPYFPNLLEVWSDGVQWDIGHWINGKIDPISTIQLYHDVDVNILKTNAKTVIIDSRSKIKTIEANNIICKNFDSSKLNYFIRIKDYISTYFAGHCKETIF